MMRLHVIAVAGAIVILNACSRAPDRAEDAVAIVTGPVEARALSRAESPASPQSVTAAPVPPPTVDAAATAQVRFEEASRAIAERAARDIKPIEKEKTIWLD